MTSRRAFAVLRARAARVGVAATVGALVLSGCSNQDAAYAQFCATSQSLLDMHQHADSLVPDQEAFDAARAGDVAPLNAWGADTQGAIGEIGATFQGALDAAPNEDVAGALKTYLAMLDVFQLTAVAASAANDVADFTTALEGLNAQGTDLTDDLTAAGQVLETTKQEHCQ